MKPLTKKQRADIYLEVAEEFESLDIYLHGHFLCHTLCDKIREPRVNNVAETAFPEFGLFKESEFVNCTWIFDSHKERATCMLLCYEMTKD